MNELSIGLGGAAQHGCAALADHASILGVCEQERVTRIRGAGFNAASGLPDEAIDLLLSRAGRFKSDVSSFILAEQPEHPVPNGVVIDRHYAHACAAFLTSSFTSAVIVVCDRELPKVSVWQGRGDKVAHVDWPWTGMGFSDLYSRCADIAGFGPGGDQRFEALARLTQTDGDVRLEAMFGAADASIRAENGWESSLSDWVNASASRSIEQRSHKASAVQNRITQLVLEFLKLVRERTGNENVCLSGDLFFHSSLNTAIRGSGLFHRVFIPVDPGSAGVAVGAALSATRRTPSLLSPFLGPAFKASETKAILDNCKLPYTLVNRNEAIHTAVDSLLAGKLVAWYEGAMEWGRRALGARSILANPFSPYVLENLNQYLKHREPWRSYALSVLDSGLNENFEGPAESPYMECDFRPRDAERYRHVLPSPKSSLRLQTVGPSAPQGFQELLVACSDRGLPSLVNTSFNGFHEPIVCSPRDAIRVFYGSGLDMLFLDGFLLVK
jgi:carbamoyltransferase